MEESQARAQSKTELQATPSPWLTLLLVLGKNRVNQILCLVSYFIQNQVKSALVKEFMFHSMYVISEEWESFQSVSEICIKRIRVNQGVGVYVGA